MSTKGDLVIFRTSNLPWGSTRDCEVSQGCCNRNRNIYIWSDVFFFSLLRVAWFCLHFVFVFENHKELIQLGKSVNGNSRDPTAQRKCIAFFLDLDMYQLHYRYNRLYFFFSQWYTSAQYSVLETEREKIYICFYLVIEALFYA